MEIELLEITKSGIIDHLVKVRIRHQPSWIGRAFFGEKETEEIVQYVGCRRLWRRLPDLQELFFMGSMAEWLNDAVEKHYLRERLKMDGKLS